MIFAVEGAPDWIGQAFSIIQSFGPAGIAAVALWWFGNRQEKRDAVLVKLHDDAVVAGDKRLDAQLTLENRRIDLMEKMVDKLEKSQVLMTQMLDRLGK